LQSTSLIVEQPPPPAPAPTPTPTPVVNVVKPIPQVGFQRVKPAGSLPIFEDLELSAPSISQRSIEYKKSMERRAENMGRTVSEI
jgi:hypothetical protein